MDRDFFREEDYRIPNPNLYVTLASSGGLWSSLTYPWTESLPWTFNAPI